APEIDGYLTEECWQNQAASWSSGFVQRLPHEGAAPSSPTYFKVLYDEKFLYVGVRCEERMATDINRRMSRRDGNNGDWVEIILDSYHDLRTAFSFSVSAAGVKSDKYITLNGAEEDIAWNPIWYTASQVLDSGWTAEMKIPLSQLRFGAAATQEWGLQVQRRILRKEELVVWQRVPQDAPGWVSEFGELKGLTGIQPQRQLEIQPFVVGAFRTFEKELANPFRDQYLPSATLGLDGKVGITNDITLDFTLNPDFGQVEADPAAIALDGFQLFFQEQRPFFIENKNVFDYRISAPTIGSPFGQDNLFYSRRIGRKPQRTVVPAEGQFVDAEQSTTILGAVKLSGKTQKGLSFGVLETVTAPEFADLSNGESALIEPLTNYLVTRALQDLNDRKTFVGGVFTSVVRQDVLATNFLHQTAHTGGVDFLHQWQDRNWYVGGNVVVSQVAGTPEAIIRTQQSIPHLFQRDAPHLRLDSTLTTLTGTGGDLKLGKAGKGHLQAEAGLTWRSPGLELNDVGFLLETDIIQQYTGISYRSINSFGIFRRAVVGYKHWLNWDFGGKLNYIDWDISAEATFQNNWSVVAGYFSQPHIYSKSLLQGGPRIRLANQYGAWWGLNSDARKQFYMTYSGWTKTGPEGAYYLLENRLGLRYQPLDRLRVSAIAKYTQVGHRLQYNQTILHEGKPRHVVSLLDQNTLSFVFRADWVLSPNMALQYYGEPFVSTGRYTRFGWVVNPLAAHGAEQLEALRMWEEAPESGHYPVDISGDGLPDSSLPNPDFSFAQFRSNLVYRWEYTPGSELFLVWSQGVTDTATPDRGLVASLRNQVFSQTLENTFLIKLTYRFHR
ncbi:MAG TPA: hydrolase, partial [Cytophagales bacterium]|nr:hydrolase [Cytophagales bacterium]